MGSLVLPLALGCGGTEGQTTAVAEPVIRSKSSGIATPALSVGDPLPPLQAEGWVGGNPPAPNAPGVRLLVVDVWGIWCPNCALTAPGLVKLHRKYSDQGVAFVSLTNVEREVVAQYVREHSIPWPNGYGATVATISALGAGSGMPGPAHYEVAPTLYLVGTDGRIVWVDGRGRLRFHEWRQWEKQVDDAIAAAMAGLPKPKP